MSAAISDEAAQLLGAVRRHALRLCRDRRLPLDLADDIVSEAYKRLLESEVVPEHLTPYMKAIVSSIVMDILNAEARVSHLETWLTFGEPFETVSVDKYGRKRRRPDWGAVTGPGLWTVWRRSVDDTRPHLVRVRSDRARPQAVSDVLGWRSYSRVLLRVLRGETLEDAVRSEGFGRDYARQMRRRMVMRLTPHDIPLLVAHLKCHDARSKGVGADEIRELEAALEKVMNAVRPGQEDAA